ncbi:MAG TPA: hypothetical protein VFT72_14485 [Opitutaceae bacterium]|nr:hypothetical protein [Opitutaceae bacterium]
MTTVSSRFETVARVLPNSGPAPAEVFGERISELYALSQKSNYVFGSPLGPFYAEGRAFHLPRFVYFGPQTHDASLRLAFLTGFDREDLRPGFALADFVEELSRDPYLGQGLNLSFFPLVDVLGFSRVTGERALANANWTRSRSPEIELLEKDARVRGYHGFVRIETSNTDDEISLRLLFGRQEAHKTQKGIKSDGVVSEGRARPQGEPSDLLTSEDFAPHAVRWETTQPGERIGDGPLTSMDNLPVMPFELRIRLPKSWAEETHRTAISSILKRFILRQRAVQAFAQHL